MTSTETKTSRFASIRLKLGERVSPLLAKVRPFIIQGIQFVKENPHLVRAVAVLPLIVTWFLALHSEEHRKAAYRGFLLSTLFLLSSWLVYWLIDTLRSFFGWGFFLQLVAFSLQGGLSLLYIGYSIRLALAEYRRNDIANEPLDRLKDLLIETI